MKLSEAKARREIIIARQLAITAELMESRRAWLQEGGGLTLPERAALEAEEAALNVEKNALDKSLYQAKSAVKQYRTTLAHATLIRLLTERGLQDIVIEADRLATDACAADIA